MAIVVPELRFVSQEARQWQAEFIANLPSKDQIDIVPVTKSFATQLTRQLLRLGEMNLYNSCQQAKRSHRLTREMARRILQVTSGKVELAPARRAFAKVVDNEAIHWDRITRVFDAGSDLVFGLAVPDTGVFMIQNGLIVAGANAELTLGSSSVA